MNTARPAWEIRTTVPAQYAAAFEEALAPFCDATAIAFDDETNPVYRLSGTAFEAPDTKAVDDALAAMAAALEVDAPTSEVEALGERDWLAQSYAGFAPISAGRFFVHGSHHDGPVPEGAVAIQVDAATAFGTGEHGTTQGCLLALHELAERRDFSRPLDMGCGSGILAIAAARLWVNPVLASDIDDEAVRVSRLNAEINGVADLVSCVAGDGFGAARVQAGAPYDLIIANILMRPLIDMAGDIARHLADGGVVVLSGFVHGDADTVAEAYRRRGLHEQRRITLGEWCSLVLHG